MPKRGLNTGLGGHARVVRVRAIVANPDGPRRERRAAAKLARKASPRPAYGPVPAESGLPVSGGPQARRALQGGGGDR